MTYLIICIIVAFSGVHLISGNEDQRFADCGSTAEVLELDFKPCPDANMCNLTNGLEVTTHFEFKLNEATTIVQYKAITSAGGQEFVVFDETTICAVSDDCSFEIGKTFNEIKTQTVRQYPSGSYTGRWEVTDDDGTLLVCFTIPFTIS